MNFTFNNIDDYNCNSLLAKINKDNITKGQSHANNSSKNSILQSLGFLCLLTAPTGLGKTYIMAAHVVDELIEITKNSYEPNIKKVIASLQEFCSWVAEIKGFESAKNNPVKIAKKILKQIENRKLWNNNKDSYRSFMSKIINQVEIINNIIQESTAKNDAKNYVKKMYCKIANNADVDNQKIIRKPIVVITDTKDNVKGFYNEVHKLIDKDHRLNDFQKSFLKSQILYLESNTDQIDKLLDNTITQVVDNYFTENKQLNNLLNECKEIKKINTNYNSPKTNNDFKESYAKLNRQLLNVYRILCDKHKNKNQKIPAALVNDMI